MRIVLLSLLLALGFSSAVSASQFQGCIEETESPLCQSYLEGLVEGALMYKAAAVGARLESNDYQSRALKYRGGKRFEAANRTFCQNRTPKKEDLVGVLNEVFTAGKIQTKDDLTSLMFGLTDCQRLK
ncbi:hypothetical protein [Shewanella youngdeokensis]|uniref:Rap1a immunity protein domain-containing protein n=1 Tax=Shewanella youngdeokensis TaxID=2999068 RepID=A0ABZ0JXR5_9GAMM|nr:hypothetical protein RGE70_13565 [Shewanella sp. DAU334]